MDGLNEADAAWLRLHQAGWSIGDTASVGPARTIWLVNGTSSGRSITAERATRAEACRAERAGVVSRCPSCQECGRPDANSELTESYIKVLDDTWHIRASVVIPNEGQPELAEAALRSVLQFLALGPDEQFAYYADPKECVTCRVSGAYSAMKKRYGHAAFFRMLDVEKTEALADLEKVCLKAWTSPNHCRRRELLAESYWAQLRDMAKTLLREFGWSTGTVERRFLEGQKEYSALWFEDEARHRKARLAARSRKDESADFSDIPEFDPRGLTVEEFRERLSRVPWFSRLGMPHAKETSVERIAGWDDWGGPESNGGAAMGAESGMWEAALMRRKSPAKAAIKALWDSVDTQAMADMPLKAEGDAWDGPTAATIHAAWVCSTIACCLAVKSSIPKNALRQWAWFTRGHWPCAYSEVDDLRPGEEGPGLRTALERARLVVY